MILKLIDINLNKLLINLDISKSLFFFLNLDIFCNLDSISTCTNYHKKFIVSRFIDDVAILF